jgi:hypothetical protein
MRSHLTGWQQLVGERGWAPKRYVERTVGSILAELVIPPPRTEGVQGGIPRFKPRAQVPMRTTCLTSTPP